MNGKSSILKYWSIPDVLLLYYIEKIRNVLFNLLHQFQQSHNYNLFFLLSDSNDWLLFEVLWFLVRMVKGKWNLTSQWRRLMKKLRDDGSK